MMNVNVAQIPLLQLQEDTKETVAGLNRLILAGVLFQYQAMFFEKFCVFQWHYFWVIVAWVTLILANIIAHFQWFKLPCTSKLQV